MQKNVKIFKIQKYLSFWVIFLKKKNYGPYYKFEKWILYLHFLLLFGEKNEWKQL